MTQSEIAPPTAAAVTPAANANVSPEHHHALKFGQVTQVLSGDCVVIQPLSPNGPSGPERILAFSNIVAPRLERRPAAGAMVNDTKDEPYAWEAREYVRKRLIGQTVAYSVEHTVTSPANRDYGVIFVGKTRDSENLTHSLISEGFAEVRRAGTRLPAAVNTLIQLEEEAKAAHKGKWSEEATAMEHVRDVKWSVEPLRQFVESRKGRRFTAIVENVRDGCTLRLLLLPEFYYITLSLTGIKTPVYLYDAISETQTPEPMAEEAKIYLEKRLLHREVEVIIEGLTSNLVMGSVFHPVRGNIAPYMLEDGIARVVDWSMASVTSNKEAYFAAENKAKSQQKGIWRDVAIGDFPILRRENKEFIALVVEINSADTITVLKDDKEQKIKFSSLRGPRLDDNRDRGGNAGKNFRPLYQIPCMYEAREFLRTRLIGQRVMVGVDYINPGNENFPEATCCTVTLNGNNIAEQLVTNGLATVVRHRRDDDQRSRAYEDLLIAESQAAKNRVGLHSANKPLLRVSDICGEIKLARNFLTGLTKGKSAAVVEHVASGGRFRMYVKSETCVLSFLLAGVDVPKPERLMNNQLLKSDPLGEEARKFARLCVLQRDVSIKVETMDRVGNFIGWLFLKDNVNFNVKLVQEGLATVGSNISDRHEFFAELNKAEEEAKAQCKNLWALPGFQKNSEHVVEEVETLDMDAASERRINFIKAVCTEVGDNLKFYVQHVQDGPKVECLMKNLQENIGSVIPGSLSNLRAGEVVACRFSLDKQWYRAKVEKKAAPNQYTVFYVDYGNRETVSVDDMCLLPSEFGLALIPANCHEYVLAFVKSPPREDLKQDAKNWFAEEVINKTFNLNIEYKVSGINAVSLHTMDDVDVGLTLVRNGKLLSMPRREPKFKSTTDKYEAAQLQAKTSRLNIWCYGDITEDDQMGP